MDGFKEVGFIYLRGHGVPPSTVDHVFKKEGCFLVTTRLFVEIVLESECRIFPFAIFCQSRVSATPITHMNRRLPQDELAWKDPRANRGYVKIGRERTTQSTDAAMIAELRKKAPDTKETMEIGRDWDKTWRNHWPQESDAPRFKQTILDFFQVRP